MTILATILICCMLTVSGFAQVKFDGKCPDLKGIKNFSATKFSGKWYEALRFYSRIEDDSKCNIAIYSPTDSDYTMKAFYHLIYRKTNKPLDLIVDLTFMDPKLGEYIKLKENLTDLVLDTDYENYIILWNCRDRARSHEEKAFILTRTANPSKKIIGKAIKSFESFGLDKSKLIVSDLRGC